ncbi:MAG: S8 family serine peptidase [bacterium]|nr:S8 family serine peptidase [bacterium]
MPKRTFLSILIVVFVLSVTALGLVLKKNNFIFKADTLSNKDKFAQTEKTYASEPSLPVDGELLVKFKEGTTKDKKDKFLAKHGAKVKDSIPQIGVDLISVATLNSPEEKAKEIRKADSDTIEFIEPNYTANQALTPNDPFFPLAQTQLQSLGAKSAWDITVGDPSVVIAVLDSGIDYTHPDFQGGRLIRGPDIVNNDDDPWDDYGHGTITTGVVGATTNNGIGIAGATWSNRILVIKVAGSNNWVSWSDMAKGLTYAADYGARVALLEAAGPSSGSTLESAIKYAYGKGTVMVAPTGNFVDPPQYPAAYPEVIAVSGINGSNQWHTGYGPYISVTAYSSGVYTTSACYPQYPCYRYGTAGGTSVAAPFVAGAAALVLSVNPALSPAQVRDIIQKSADDLGDPGWDQYYGWGRVNLYKAVVMAGGVIPQPTKGTITGKVTQSGTAIPVIGATVEAKQSGVSKGTAQTLSDGSYTFSLDAGSYDVTVSATNYVSQTRTGVSVTAGGTTSGINFALSLIAAPDTTPPTVSLTYPANGQTIKMGTKVNIAATATDNVKVTKVEFYINGFLKAADTASPYSYTWNTRGKGISAGTYTILAKAYDAAGNISQSQISVTLTK